MHLDQASGPEQIRAAFTTAITIAGDHADELTGIAGVLDGAADRYETLHLSSHTVGRLRHSAAAVTAAAAAASTGHDRLQAALADFHARDGAVAEAVAAAGNLMRFDELADVGGLPAPAGTHLPSPEPDGKAMTNHDATPADPRTAAMRRYGIDRCPDWCKQDPDEHNYEEHVGPGETYTTDGTDEIVVRPRVSWFPDGEATVEIVAPPTSEHGVGLILTSRDLQRLTTLAERLLDQADDHLIYDDPARTKPAYPGAGTTTMARDPDTAPGEDYDGGMYLAPNDGRKNRPYLDWSRTDPDGSVYLELGEEYDAAAEAKLNPAQLQGLRNALAHTLGLTDDADPALGDGYYLDDDAGTYIDFSSTHSDGRICFELGDNKIATNQLLSREQLHHIHDRLTDQITRDATPAG